jgi:hypothetical protein
LSSFELLCRFPLAASRVRDVLLLDGCRYMPAVVLLESHRLAGYFRYRTDTAPEPSRRVWLEAIGRVSVDSPN